VSRSGTPLIFGRASALQRRLEGGGEAGGLEDHTRHLPPSPSPASLVFLNELKLDPCGNRGFKKKKKEKKNTSIHKKKKKKNKSQAVTGPQR